MKYSNIMVLSVAAFGLVACASAPAPVATEQNVQAVRVSDEPAAPPVAAVMPVSAPANAVADAASDKKEGVPAVAKRMQKNRLTQYWREKNTYTYFVGSQVEAEFKPGQALTLRDDSQENGVTCTFALAGGLAIAGGPADPAAAAKNQDRCNEMMFTLDQQLGE